MYTTPAIINGLPFLCSNRDPEKFNEAYLGNWVYHYAKFVYV